jgi:hypothetical protein
MTEVDPLSVVSRIGEALDRLGVAWFLGGSLASSLHGEPRATNDIDLVADLDPAGAARLGEELGSDFLVDEEELIEAVGQRRASRIYFQPWLTKIDLFVAGKSPFDRSELDRRRQVEVLPGVAIWVKSPEDSVLRKLLWYRAGGEVSQRQGKGVVEILRVSGAVLDGGYLDRWAHPLGVGDLLARARLEVGEPGA